MRLPDRELSQSQDIRREQMNKREEGINSLMRAKFQVQQACAKFSQWGSPPWGFMPDICQKFFLANGKNLWEELGKPMSSYQNCPATIFCDDVIKIIDKHISCEHEWQNRDRWVFHNEGYKVEKSGGKFTILHKEPSTHLSQVTSVSSSPTKAMLPDKSASIKAGKISIEPGDIDVSDGSWNVLLPSDAIRPVYEKPVLAVPSETTTLSATSSSATTVLLPTTSSTAATTPGLTATIPTTSTSEPSTSTTPLRITARHRTTAKATSRPNTKSETNPPTTLQMVQDDFALIIEDLAKKTSTQNSAVLGAINFVSTLIGAVTSVLPKSTTPGIGYSKVLGLTSAEVTTPGFSANGTANEGGGNDIVYPKDHPIFGLRLPGNGSDITVGGVLNHTIDEFRKIITQDNSNKPLSPAQLSWIIAACVGGALLLISGGSYIIYRYCCKPAGGEYNVREADQERSLDIGNEAPGADLLAEANEVDGVVVTNENDALIESAEVPLRSNANLLSSLLPEPNDSLSPTNSLQIPTSESKALLRKNSETQENSNVSPKPFPPKLIQEITEKIAEKKFQDSQKSATPKKTESTMTVTIELAEVNNGHSKPASKVPNLYVSGGSQELNSPEVGKAPHIQPGTVSKTAPPTPPRPNKPLPPVPPALLAPAKVEPKPTVKLLPLNEEAPLQTISSEEKGNRETPQDLNYWIKELDRINQLGDIVDSTTATRYTPPSPSEVFHNYGPTTVAMGEDAPLVGVAPESHHDL
ncbi:hypothetical protein [Candidatus Tisiphia endosymbiont of Beris chalybata]|uniref:hypothetical protein n=1 Tax=Candidatus Tisiphia endosymbiont of Beris chalybata TaxID=3066262 RepID=UPI00312CB3DB